MLSIIVPVFNAINFIRPCLCSILSQTCSDFELLLVDDGSEDGSGGVCDEFARRDTRVKVFHIENCGVSVARNTGLDNAKGEWIYFADSDDELFPSAFQTLLEGINAETEFCMAGYEVFTEEGKRDFWVDKREASYLSPKECLEQMYSPKYYYYQGYLWNKLFKADIIKQSKLKFDEDIKFNEDRLFCVKYLCCCTGNVYYTTSPVYKYFRRPTGAMASLERGFNADFLTDFDAFVRMKELVVESFPEKRMVRMAKDGIRGSYDNIVSMIHRFDVDEQSVIPQLKKSLRQALGLYYYMPYYKKVKHKAKQILFKRCPR